MKKKKKRKMRKKKTEQLQELRCVSEREMDDRERQTEEIFSVSPLFEFFSRTHFFCTFPLLSCV